MAGPCREAKEPVQFSKSLDLWEKARLPEPTTIFPGPYPVMLPLSMSYSDKKLNGTGESRNPLKLV